jgi:hypothetical protein
MLPFSGMMIDLEFLIGELVAVDPSGMAVNMVCKLSTRESLNFYVSFLRAANLISSLVDYSFCFFISYLNSSSVFYRELIIVFNLAC